MAEDGYKNFHEDVMKILEEHHINGVDGLRQVLKEREKCSYRICVTTNLCDIRTNLCDTDTMICEGFVILPKENIIITRNPVSEAHPNYANLPNSDGLIDLNDGFWKEVSIRDRAGNLLFIWRKEDKK